MLLPCVQEMSALSRAVRYENRCVCVCERVFVCVRLSMRERESVCLCLCVCVGVHIREGWVAKKGVLMFFAGLHLTYSYNKTGNIHIYVCMRACALERACLYACACVLIYEGWDMRKCDPVYDTLLKHD